MLYESWRSDSCSKWLLGPYKDPHLSLATGILYNFHTAFAIMVKHSCLCLVTWNNSGHIIQFCDDIEEVTPVVIDYFITRTHICH